MRQQHKRAVLTTGLQVTPSLALYLSSHGESLPSVPDAYGQSLEASGIISLLYLGASPHVPAYEHIPSHGGSEAHSGPPDSILSYEPKPLGKHKPPPPQSVLSPDELFYPP
ncbi:hypothetical protein Tco_1175003 [Tanacetum coccineum]